MIEGPFQIFWTQTAQQDLRMIIEYIASDSEVQASRIYQDIKLKAKNLSLMPFQGRIVPELRFFNIMTYRELIVSPWRLIYKIEGNKVWVLAVFDTRRDLEDLLLDRVLWK